VSGAATEPSIAKGKMFPMRLRTTVALLLALSLGSCTGGTGNANGPICACDAAVPNADARQVCSSCNPVTQACCDLGEKCAHLLELEDPRLARTACVPVGVVPEGKACRRGEAGPATGFDDCAAGLHCLHGVCAKICHEGPPDSCRASDEAEGTGSYCKLIDNVFSDRIGVCVQAPDQ
jgi:hypothetical protein